MTINVSNSSIQNFKFCRRMYWLENYRKMKPKEVKTTGALALGSRIHLALEMFYNALADGATVEQANIEGIWSDLVERDRGALEAMSYSTDDLDAESELGRIMLEGYIEWMEDNGYMSEYNVTSQEEMLSYPFFDGMVNLVGKIDQRLTHKLTGTRHVLDYKTTAQMEQLSSTINQSEQFLTYMLLEMLQYGDVKEVSTALVVALKKVKRTARAKPPFYAAWEVDHNVYELRNFYLRIQGELQQIMDLHDRLDAGEDHHVVAYPTPSKDCSWRCNFAKICPLFDDGSDAERALAEDFYEGDPFDYYGEDSPTNK